MYNVHCTMYIAYIYIYIYIYICILYAYIYIYIYIYAYSSVVIKFVITKCVFMKCKRYEYFMAIKL